jgi:hypothetical protein
MTAKTTQRRKEEPRVGIFWAIDGKPLIDTTPLSEAEPYGDCLTHPRGHAAVWEHYQASGIVPKDAEYEEFPRGRVMYNTKTRRYALLADRCILKDEKLVRRILSELQLPRTTEKSADSHYRCSSCLHRWAD